VGGLKTPVLGVFSLNKSQRSSVVWQSWLLYFQL
jgi:hypothetical protein